MSNKEYDINLAIKNQAELCKRKDHPNFAPSSGRCYKCNRNIYEQIGWAKLEYGRRRQVPLDSKELHRTTGITAKRAGEELVTGCPHCNRSYCD